MAVFNSGMINADLVEDDSEDPVELKVPALIFLDSLKLHDAAVIARNIRAWLNHEWDKKHSLTNCRIFNEQYMQLFRPTGKYFAFIMYYQLLKRCLYFTSFFPHIQFLNKPMALTVDCLSADMRMHYIKIALLQLHL